MEAASRNTARLGPDEGRPPRAFGELATHEATVEQNGEAYSLFEVVSRPGGGSPPHVRLREDECFYVPEGEFGFLVSDKVGAGAGSLPYVPKGCLHAQRRPRSGEDRRPRPTRRREGEANDLRTEDDTSPSIPRRKPLGVCVP